MLSIHKSSLISTALFLLVLSILWGGPLSCGPPAGECTQDLDCIQTLGSDWFCQAAANQPTKCVQQAAPPECKFDLDCPDGKLCQSGKCVAKPSCQKDAECTAPQKCLAGRCTTPPCSCKTNADCGTSGLECRDCACVRPLPDCIIDADCAPKGAQFVCVDSRCVVTEPPPSEPSPDVQESSPERRETAPEPSREPIQEAQRDAGQESSPPESAPENKEPIPSEKP